MRPLDSLREEIDVVDIKLLGLLSRRMELARDIASYKQSAKLPVHDPDREGQVLKRWEEKANALDLPVKGVIAILQEVISMSKSVQERCKK